MSYRPGRSSRQQRSRRQTAANNINYADDNDDDDDDDQSNNNNKNDDDDDSSVEILLADQDDDDDDNHLSSDLDDSDDEGVVVGRSRRTRGRRRGVALRVSSRTNKTSVNFRESDDDDEEEEEEEDESQQQMEPQLPSSSTTTSRRSTTNNNPSVRNNISDNNSDNKRGKKRKSDEYNPDDDGDDDDDDNCSGGSSSSNLDGDSDTVVKDTKKKNSDPPVEEDEPREYESFKISKVVARCSRTLADWKKLCMDNNMDTSLVNHHGSRWAQDDSSSDDEDVGDDTAEERYLIKWSDSSYMHCSWETKDDLLELIEGSHAALSRFNNKYPDGLAYDHNERCDGQFFDPAWTQVDRIMEIHYPDSSPTDSSSMGDNEDNDVTNEDFGIVLDVNDDNHDKGLGRQFLIKWENQPYSDCSWEYERDMILKSIEYNHQLQSFVQRSTAVDEADASERRSTGEKESRRLYKDVFGEKSETRHPGAVETYQSELAAHEYPNGGKLRDYQAEGVAWMLSNYLNQRNSILADEMGLGKTIQLASFLGILAHRFHRRGPFLIVVPLSTLCNWKRELDDWLGFNTIVYHGTADNREFIRRFEVARVCDRPKSCSPNELYLRKCAKKHNNALGNPWMAEVILTTPELLCAEDFSELTAIKWECLVVDEAHRLKNHSSKFAVNLRDHKFAFKHKVLLTGTPIQNTVKELFALLNFVDPFQFGDCDEFLAKYGDMQSKDHVDELHGEIRPYLLRRLKEDVEKSVPPKEETVVEVELTVAQKQYYRALYEKNIKFLHRNKKKALDGPSLNNLALQLRKCCLHLFLLNGIEEEFRKNQISNGQSVSEADLLVAASGKLVLMDKLLSHLKQGGHRVLIFSQFTMMLDVLEDYLSAREMSHERIDGSITGKRRQQAIDRFQAPDSSGKELPFVMLLSTRAGSLGLNLTAADTCIIFDSDWNPQSDLQAMARCHRIGQSKSVKIYRLVTAKTYEMQMFHRSSLKLGLDQAVLSGFEAGSSGENALSKDEIERLLRHGAYGILNEEKDGTGEAASKAFAEADIASILANRSHTVVYDNTGSKSSAKNGKFSKARFTSSSSAGQNPQENIDIEDPDFWTKMLGDIVEEESEVVSGKRARNITTYSLADYDQKLRKDIGDEPSPHKKLDDEQEEEDDDDEEDFEEGDASENSDDDDLDSVVDQVLPASKRPAAAGSAARSIEPGGNNNPNSPAVLQPTDMNHRAVIEAMPTHELIQELSRFGISAKNMLEKSELVNALIEARANRDVGR